MFFLRRRRHPISDEELSAYVDGHLEPAARARLEGHVEACAACREALAELRALRRALGELPRAAAPRSFALREQEVRPLAAPRAMGALGRAPALLGGLAAVAFLTFWALVSVDVLTQPSEEVAASVAFEPWEGALEKRAADSASATPGALADRLPSDAEEGTKAEAGTAPELEPARELRPPTPQAMPTPAPAAEAERAGGSRVPLRAGEAAAAAVALVAASSLALVWWRRRP